jgi:uncharacterized membrane protein
MNFAVELFAPAWLWGAGVLAAIVAGWIVRTAPWACLAESRRMHIWLGLGVMLALVWSLKAGVYPGLDLHLLGAMVVTLVMGPQLGMAALALALAGVTLNGGAQWQSFPINWLVMGVFPVAVAHGYFRLVERYAPKHFFVFIFVIAFFGSALTVNMQGAFASFVLWAAGAYSYEFLAANYLPYFLLLGFSEAWLSGMVVTLMVVFRPGWVLSFDDRVYLWNK